MKRHACSSLEKFKDQREKIRVFSLGKFNPTELPITGETIFGTKQCSERMFKVVKEHCDEKAPFLKGVGIKY